MRTRRNQTEGAGATRGAFDRIYTTVRDRICLLDYPPGTMLSENKLAQEFGVSRTPIRRVLQTLEFDGLVESTHGVGTMVTTLDMRELRQVYALRLKLIDLIAELPVGTLTGVDLAALERMHGRAIELRDGPGDPRALAALYQEFNQELSRVIANRPLKEIADRYFYQTSRVWLQLLPEMEWRQEAETVAEEILDVVSALRAHDLRRLSEVRRRYFQSCLRRMNTALVGQDLADAVLSGRLPGADAPDTPATRAPEGGDRPTEDASLPSTPRPDPT